MLFGIDKIRKMWYSDFEIFSKSFLCPTQFQHLIIGPTSTQQKLVLLDWREILWEELMGTYQYYRHPLPLLKKSLVGEKKWREKYLVF